jgi:DNA-binding MarR family transcriptional regulator
MLPLPNEYGTPAYKLARRTSPETSKTAARSVNTTKLETMVLEIIAAFGAGGCISDDVRAVAADRGVTSYSSVTARYRALEDKGLIEFTGDKRLGNSGRPQRVMRATA